MLFEIWNSLRSSVLFSHATGNNIDHYKLILNTAMVKLKTFLPQVFPPAAACPNLQFKSCCYTKCLSIPKSLMQNNFSWKNKLPLTT